MRACGAGRRSARRQSGRRPAPSVATSGPPSAVSDCSPSVPASASGRETCTVPRTSELGKRRRHAEHRRREVQPQSSRAEDGVRSRRAHVERLRHEHAAHALGHAARAAGRGHVVPEQRGGAAHVRGGAGGAAAGVDLVGLRVARRDQDVRGRRDVRLEAAVVRRPLRRVRLGQQRRRVERADGEGAGARRPAWGSSRP